MGEIVIPAKFNAHKNYKKMMFLNPYRDVGGSTPLLLDLYPGAQFAYSLQYLKTGVVNVLRVVRTNDSTERDFTPIEITNGTLVSWVGAGNNGFVKTEYDQNGNGRHLNFSGLTNKIVNNGALLLDNGMPYIEYTGDSISADYSITGGSGLNADNASVFCTYNSNSNDNGSILTGSSIFSFLGIMKNGNTTSPHLNSGNPLYFADGLNITAPTRAKLYTNYVKNKDVLSTILNINFTDLRWSNTAIPFAYAQTLFSAPCKSKEFIVYNSDQTANKEGIEANIKTRYGIV